MTKVRVFKTNDFTSKLEVKGHALSGEYGHDVVCAGISTVVTGVCNALEELTNYNEDLITITEGLVIIPELMNEKQVQLVIDVLIVQLKMIEKMYPEYIEISYL